MKEKSKVFCIIGSHKRSMIDLLFVEGDFFFFLITVAVWARLLAPRLIPWGPEVNDRVQWP